MLEGRCDGHPINELHFLLAVRTIRIMVVCAAARCHMQKTIKGQQMVSKHEFDVIAVPFWQRTSENRRFKQKQIHLILLLRTARQRSSIHSVEEK